MQTSLHSNQPAALSAAMRCGLLPLIAASLLLGGCASPGRAGLHNHHAAAPAPEPYVRISNTDSNHIALQIAARAFLPKRRGAPVIWLMGVSHIGESNYYAELQTQLDAQTLVLFEGVGAAEREASDDNVSSTSPSGSANEAMSRAGDNRASLQSTMAESLGLVFQLEAIDYRRANFRNSDLSITQLRQLISEQESGSGTPGASESFESLLALMEGNSWLDSLLQLALRLLGTNPKFQALGRLALIDLLGQIQGDPSRLEGLPPELKQLLEVLLQRRNEKVITDLKSELSRVGRHGSIAVFFGTGHMPDLEKRLREELNYRPAQEVWFTVFEVDLAKSKVSQSERAFVDDFVKWQLAAASHGATK